MTAGQPAPLAAGRMRDRAILRASCRVVTAKRHGGRDRRLRIFGSSYLRRTVGCTPKAFSQSQMLKFLAGVPAFVLAASAAAQNPNLVVYQGDKGPGHGKHIVFLAGDHEYRSEESLPALARILAKHYGFKCSVFFTTDPKTGFIEPGSSNISGLEALKTADLLVVFLRFQDFPDDQMQHIVDYLDRGGPVVGFRTATHAFQIKRPDAKFLKYRLAEQADDYPGRFRPADSRRDVGVALRHAITSRARGCCCSRIEQNHPILRGVKDV